MLIEELKQQQVIVIKEGIETINGVPLNKFIHVGAKFNQSAWNVNSDILTGSHNKLE